MKQVWKYALEVRDEATIATLRGCKPLSVQVQNGAPCLWAEIDPEEELCSATVFVHGTGHLYLHPEGTQYVGTFQMEYGNLVFHVFFHQNTGWRS